MDCEPLIGLPFLAFFSFPLSSAFIQLAFYQGKTLVCDPKDELWRVFIIHKKKKGGGVWGGKKKKVCDERRMEKIMLS